MKQNHFCKLQIPFDVLASIILLCMPIIGLGQSGMLNSHQWAATDALGRKLPGFSEIGSQESGKLVGMFYWTWHQDGPGNKEPHNLTELLVQ